MTDETTECPETFSLPIIGDPAPDFYAVTTEGPISFSTDMKGKWVVLFSHPADFTDFTLFGEVVQDDMDTLRDVSKKPELMQEAYDKAKAMVSEILSNKNSE